MEVDKNKHSIYAEHHNTCVLFLPCGLTTKLCSWNQDTYLNCLLGRHVRKHVPLDVMRYCSRMAWARTSWQMAWARTCEKLDESICYEVIAAVCCITHIEVVFGRGLPLHLHLALQISSLGLKMFVCLDLRFFALLVLWFLHTKSH